MPLTQFIRALSSDGDDTAGRGGHDSDDDGSPAGLLGYLPWCLYWPWSLHGMTQCQVEIKRPSVNRLSRVMVYDGGLWDMQSSATQPVTHAETVIYPTLIGLRAAVGGSAAKFDWLGALGPADGPPGGIWIGFKSVVAVTVTGSLKFPMLASRRDTDIIYRHSTLRDCCETAWSLQLLCRTDSIAMDAAGFSMIDNRYSLLYVRHRINCAMGRPGDGDGSLGEGYCAAR